MTELIVKMTFWLLLAIILGFIFGWILSRIRKNEKYEMEVDSLNSMLYERNESIDKLTHDYEKSTEMLSEKTNLLSEVEKSLEKSKNNQNSKQKHPDIKELIQEIELLKKIDEDRKLELDEFEKVVIKAEDTLEAHNDIVQKLENKIELLVLENDEKMKAIDLYKETIIDFENELKLYTAGKEDPEFVISKDQFVQIEEQLLEYQKEIEALKKINSELNVSGTAESLKAENHEEKDLDEGTVVKIFKETYKKITNS